MNTHKLPVVLLVGGLGTRLKQLFPNTPKAMIEIKGKPFLEWLLLYLGNFGFKNIIISVSYLAERIENYFSKVDLDMKITFIKESIPLGTGGAIVNASGQIKSKYFVAINGDSIVLLDFKKFVHFYYNNNVDILIAVKKVKGADRYGIIRCNSNSEIITFKEKEQPLRNHYTAFINAGIYLFSKKSLQRYRVKREFPLSIESDILPHLLRDNKLKIMAFETKGGFIDIGTPESFYMAEEFITTHMDSITDKYIG